jgi:transposase
MPHFVGLDVSKETTSICVLDKNGKNVLEGVVPTEPGAIADFLRGRGWRCSRIGMEAWGLATWLYEGLARLGLPIICIEARHASAVLKAARVNKTDRNDARGIAEMMHAGIYKTVHIKTKESQRSLAALTARTLLRSKARDIENGVRSILLGFGFKMKTGAASTYERRVRELISADEFIKSIVEPLLLARNELARHLDTIDRDIRKRAQDDPVCRRLMTAPGVGEITALACRLTIDRPERFPRSASVGPHLGLTPATRQSGTRDRKGRISLMGDRTLRSLLYMGAKSLFRRNTPPSWLKTWGEQIRAKRGASRAFVAVARKLAVILHKMWITGSDFRHDMKSA